eukprot:TRINITY_DN5738_c0_g1_i1.p1 TRINITY_DN5738_c0_g1~~TRINITY_DN5738_c0_g1_i1.p1  ORF type:complete len:177 (-),score=40.14 TRINITY_DN5738_c0_g1_i1:158-688(-)
MRRSYHVASGQWTAEELSLKQKYEHQSAPTTSGLKVSKPKQGQEAIKAAQAYLEQKRRNAINTSSGGSTFKRPSSHVPDPSSTKKRRLSTSRSVPSDGLTSSSGKEGLLDSLIFGLDQQRKQSQYSNQIPSNTPHQAPSSIIVPEGAPDRSPQYDAPQENAEPVVCVTDLSPNSSE